MKSKESSLQQYLRERGYVEKEESPKPRRHVKHKESTVQQHCVSWFKREYPELAPLYFMVANGVQLSKSQAKIAVAEGLTKGVSDTLLLVSARGYHGIAIEFKKEELDYDENGKIKKTRTYQRPEQREWQKLVEAQGFLYKVIRTKEEFIELIEWYFGK